MPTNNTEEPRDRSYREIMADLDRVEADLGRSIRARSESPGPRLSAAAKHKLDLAMGLRTADHSRVCVEHGGARMVLGAGTKPVPSLTPARPSTTSTSSSTAATSKRPAIPSQQAPAQAAELRRRMGLDELGNVVAASSSAVDSNAHKLTLGGAK
jgi:hypothetical protein